MAAEAVVLTRLESPSEMMRLISNDNAFLNDLNDLSGGGGGNNFDQRTLFARFDCGGGEGGDVSMFVQG